MELRYKLSERDISDYFFQLKKKTYVAGAVIGGAAVFVVLFCILQDYLPGTWPVIIGLTAVFTVAVYFLLRYTNFLSSKLIAKKLGKEFFDLVQTVSLMEDGVLDHCDLQDTKIPYNKISKIEETTDYITIKANLPLLFIPIRNIQNPEDTNAFLAELKSKIQ